MAVLRAFITRFLSVFVIINLAAMSAPAVARPLDDVKKSGFVTVFVYADYAPYSWLEDGEMRGIDVDIAKEIADWLGVELRLMVRQGGEQVDDDLRVNIWRGDIVKREAADVMLHVPFDRTLEIRSESLAILFNPYFGEEVALAVDREKLPDLTTFAKFVYNPIAVELDTVSDFFLANAFNGQLQKNIRRGRIFSEAVDIYRKGDAPALMGSRAQMEWVKSQVSERETYIVQPPTPGIIRAKWPIGMAVKHDSRDLGYELGAMVETLLENGRLEDIHARYGVTYVKPQLD